MKDLTKKIEAFGRAKQASELRMHNDKVASVKEYIKYIEGRHDELDTLIANANAAVEAGIKLNKYNDSQFHFENKNFMANGIRHRLGFIRSEIDKSVVGMGTIGGGWNGDVSVVYMNGEVIYDTDKHYRHNKAFQATHPLDEMNDVLLSHYHYAIKTFADDIDSFSKCFEEYLENIING